MSAAFEVIPAIDLLDGRCVRLSQGRYDAATVYSERPERVATELCAQPIRRLHVVDLDGARAGRRANRAAVRAILEAAAQVPVQLGGGLRSPEDVAEALGDGVDRVILGTVALRDPELVRSVAREHPGRVVVGVDARRGQVAVEGWTEASETPATDLAKRFEDAGIAALIYTEIERDGMLTGPDLEGTAALAEAVSIPVIASGGVGSEDDIARAAGYAGRGVAGVIVGRALYTGAVDLGRALARAACS